MSELQPDPDEEVVQLVPHRHLLREIARR